ncbi:5-formyltetrahydrofolate cyclo-ligase [Neogemmobacter tilapiae]|uniref:5-formyltetrahydrofolate cyclo-ligase n=1 Tax=Neogemmobacter tilapiae TaxID=875041 RepID=A0A918THJ8_9RHOB|nr:5-formyltetrahydrofolate cyclo-ligase [Gemmobacter tilapiae]GHC47133.1 5-formyltetrahydrofolate cyclo-ligase [Gemmobacter tilapiae]
MNPLASPVCYAEDAEQARDVANWRRAERKHLLTERAALSITDRQAMAQALAGHLDQLLARRFGTMSGLVLSFYWPIQSELDLRFWAVRVHNNGVKLALPVVETPQAPLIFRPWTPGCAMQRGFWNIPVPDTVESVLPDIALAPLVGWDDQGYRLGYGGGYFDRTLAAIRPHAIGVGLSQARLTTIFPQVHDIRLDAILTEKGTAHEQC